MDNMIYWCKNHKQAAEELLTLHNNLCSGNPSSLEFKKKYSMYKFELDPEKQLKIKSEIFLKGVNISANQMISGDSKGINNKLA